MKTSMLAVLCRPEMAMGRGDGGVDNRRPGRRQHLTVRNSDLWDTPERRKEWMGTREINITEHPPIYSPERLYGVSSILSTRCT